MYIYIYIYKISNETSEMISKYKKFSSKPVSCIHLRYKLKIVRNKYTKLGLTTKPDVVRTSDTTSDL